jgi:heme/copper-type cytochrome/quinol oxidase subunit 2
VIYGSRARKQCDGEGVKQQSQVRMQVYQDPMMTMMMMIIIIIIIIIIIVIITETERHVKTDLL